jgi:hypothetical protein
MPIERVETLIIGGGQAGLTMSHMLSQRRQTCAVFVNECERGILKSYEPAPRLAMGSHGIITPISRTNQAEGKVFRPSFQYAHIAILLEGQNTSMAAATLIGASQAGGCPTASGDLAAIKTRQQAAWSSKTTACLIACNEPETVRKCHDKQYKPRKPF